MGIYKRITIVEYYYPGRILITCGAITGSIAAGFIATDLIGIAVSALFFALTICLYITAGIAILLGSVKAYTLIRDRPVYRAIQTDIAYRSRVDQHRLRARSTIHVDSQIDRGEICPEKARRLH